MSKTMRTVRNVTALAATGALAFSLSGCGVIMGDGKDKKADDKKTTETAEPTEETKDPETTPADDPSTDGSSSNSSSGVVRSGFSEADKTAGAQALSNLLTKMADGDYEGACGHAIITTTNPPTTVTDSSTAKLCAAGMKSEMDPETVQNLKQAKSFFTPENIEMNDDGSFKVMGTTMPGMKAVKLESDGKMYIEVPQN